jgi:hypothetical protein
MNRTRVKVVLGAVATAVALTICVPAQADPLKCQKTVAKVLESYKKTYLKAQLKCLNLVNLGLFPAPCPGDPMTSKFAAKIEKTRAKAVTKIATYCLYPGDLTALEFHDADCSYGPADSAAETTCAGKTVSNSSEFGDCLACWKAAELAEYVSILFASQAVQNCGGALDSTSTVCSNIDCPGATLPDQRNLGDTSENDCQLSLAKGSINYILKREKVMEKCALKNITRANCLTLFADKFAAIVQQNQSKIQMGCGVRDPAPHPPFCCKSTGNQCTLPSPDTRDQCITDGGQPGEDKFCDMGSCSPVQGNKKLTWWGVCPEDDTASCTTTLTQQDDMIACVHATADAIVDRLTCLQFPRNGGADYPCP